jgi:hypothetical protein
MPAAGIFFLLTRNTARVVRNGMIYMRRAGLKKTAAGYYSGNVARHRTGQKPQHFS